MKQKFNIEAIRQLHREGKLDQAKEGYLAILRINPRDAEILHALGIIHTQQKNFSEAIEYLQKATKLNPKDPSIQLNLANVLKHQGLFSQSEQLLKKIIVDHPGYAPAFNNIGIVYYALGKLDEAITAYHTAIEIFPNYIDAFYNLGLALTKKNLLKDAIEIYQKILEKTPDHFAARFHLACILMQQENLTAAIKEFLAIEITYPFHLETQTNLANCYVKQGALNEAKTHYIKALAIHPEDIQIVFNMGVINMQQGNIDQAIQYYQRAVSINPNYFAAQNNLGVAFLAKEHRGYALQHFQEALRIQPHNKAVEYTVSMLAQNQRLLTAPPDYIQSLFDAYADHYDAHLLTALDYQIPTLFQNATVNFLPTKKLDILDLGCGTGLCAIPFKSHAHTLSGVDLSENMLAMARQKNIYNQLIKSDLTTFLTDKTAAYDLILAGDVLVYIGELESILQLIQLALREKGLFVFNAEISVDNNYKMNQSGRFTHSKHYLDALTAKNRFKIENYQTCVTRLQNNEPVYGHLYVLRMVSHFGKNDSDHHL